MNNQPIVLQGNPVPELQRLLGSPVVFINWPNGVKGNNQRRWKHLTAADMTTEYLMKLQRGNVGVAVGEVSGGLCPIDIDKDSLVEPFLAANPKLNDTLQTHGARGRVFWVRWTGNYLKRTVKLKTPSGEDAGEFRSNGGQSIVWGIHPDTSQPYQIVVNKPAMTMDFDSLRWPDGIINPFQERDWTEDTEDTEDLKNRRVRRTEEPKSSVFLGFVYSKINTVEDALLVAMPVRERENNQLLFKLARAIKTLELKGQVFGIPELEAVFDRWYAQAREFLRNGQTKEDYYLEFMNACEKAKFPLGSVKVGEAWARAKSQPLPEEAMRFTNPDMRLLIAFLKHLQILVGDEPLFVTYRDCASLLGHKSHSTVETWIGALAKLKYIRFGERGNEHRANRYYYIWKPTTHNVTPPKLTIPAPPVAELIPSLNCPPASCTESEMATEEVNQ